MLSHLIFPYNWVKCVEPETCERSAHVNMDSATLNSYPLEWVVELLDCYSLGTEHIFWRNENNELHNINGPAVEEESVQEWFLNDKLHREDGPAIKWGNGQKEWWLNGFRHCEEGPAVIKADGTKEWWLNNERHREDGPAVETRLGVCHWWLNGESYTEQQHAEIMKAKESWSII